MHLVMPAHNYKTWAIAAPPETHRRPATCREVDCPEHIAGWTQDIDVTTPEGRDAVDWIRTQSGRHFTAERLPGGQVRFRFPAGQRCFGWRSHSLPVGRPEIFLRVGGHYQAYDPSTRFVHTRPEDWRDEFGEHQERLITAIERG